MLDSILVPLDSSQLAECVLPHVAAVAEAFMSKIILIRVLEKNQTSATVQLFDLLNWQIKKTEASLYLDKAKLLLQRANLRIDTTVLEGLVAETITEFSQRQGVQLIIMSSHGRSGLTQWGISSITQKIILSAPTSVLIVRAHPQENRVNESPAHPLYQRILVPLDGSQRAENVFPIIAKLAHFHKSEIHLVQVIQKPEMARQMPPTNEDIELSNRLVTRNQEEAGCYLEQVKSRSYLEGIAVHTHLITSTSTAAELHQVAARENIDLVTLSAHGYSGDHQWPYGSFCPPEHDRHG